MNQRTSTPSPSQPRQLPSSTWKTSSLPSIPASLGYSESQRSALVGHLSATAKSQLMRFHTTAPSSKEAFGLEQTVMRRACQSHEEDGEEEKANKKGRPTKTLLDLLTSKHIPVVARATIGQRILQDDTIVNQLVSASTAAQEEQRRLKKTEGSELNPKEDPDEMILPSLSTSSPGRQRFRTAAPMNENMLQAESIRQLLDDDGVMKVASDDMNISRTKPLSRQEDGRHDEDESEENVITDEMIRDRETRLHPHSTRHHFHKKRSEFEEKKDFFQRQARKLSVMWDGRSTAMEDYRVSCEEEIAAAFSGGGDDSVNSSKQKKRKHILLSSSSSSAALMGKNGAFGSTQQFVSSSGSVAAARDNVPSSSYLPLGEWETKRCDEAWAHNPEYQWLIRGSGVEEEPVGATAAGYSLNDGEELDWGNTGNGGGCTHSALYQPNKHSSHQPRTLPSSLEKVTGSHNRQQGESGTSLVRIDPSFQCVKKNRRKNGNVSPSLLRLSAPTAPSSSMSQCRVQKQHQTVIQHEQELLRERTRNRNVLLTAYGKFLLDKTRKEVEDVRMQEDARKIHIPIFLHRKDLV